MAGTRSSRFSHGELNVLITSLEANRELALNDYGSSVKNTEERRKEWNILTDLINTVGNQNRSVHNVRCKWNDLKSRTRKKYFELKAENFKSDGRSIHPLTDIEQRILNLVGTEPESSASWRKDIMQQYESAYETTFGKTHIVKTLIKTDKSLDNLEDSSNQPDDSTFLRENYSSDNDQRPSTSQEEEGNVSDDREMEETVHKVPLKLGSRKSLSFRINCHRKNKGSLLQEKIKNTIKTRSHMNNHLADIKSLLQETVKIQKQMLENQKLELMLLAKIADAELLYDD